MGAGDEREVAAVSAAAMDAVRARTDDEMAAMGAGDERVVAAVSAAATAAASAAATDAECHAPLHATVGPLVHGPVQRYVDQVLVTQRAVVADTRVMVGPLVDRPALEASTVDSNLAAVGGVGEGSFHVGALTVSLPASPCKFSTEEPPSLQTLDYVAGPFVPCPLLGLEAFASPAFPAAARQGGPGEDAGPFGQDDARVRGLACPVSPVAARQDGPAGDGGPFGQDDDGPFAQDDDGLRSLAGAHCQVLALSNPPSPVLDASRVEEMSDDEGSIKTSQEEGIGAEVQAHVEKKGGAKCCIKSSRPRGRMWCGRQARLEDGADV
ncbi:hypothetical protein ACQ4PT_052753 [Festuca glaucescens]